MLHSPSPPLATTITLSVFMILTLPCTSRKWENDPILSCEPGLERFSHTQVESSPGSFHWAALSHSEEGKLVLGTACLSAVAQRQKLAQPPGPGAAVCAGAKWSLISALSRPSPPGANEEVLAAWTLSS